MDLIAWVQLGTYLAALFLLAWPPAARMQAVIEGQFALGRRIEAPLLRLAGVDERQEHGWLPRALDLLLLNAVGVLAVFALQERQAVLPLNPTAMPAVSVDSALNTAIGFVTNTNWQGHAGEARMSDPTQMLALTAQNFLSAASGIAVAVVLIRGFARHSASGVGNVWVDLTRITLWVLSTLALRGTPPVDTGHEKASTEVKAGSTHRRVRSSCTWPTCARRSRPTLRGRAGCAPKPVSAIASCPKTCRTAGMIMPMPRIAVYQRWLEQHRGLHFDSYDALWRWSITDLRGFWRSIWDYFDLQSPTAFSTELVEPVMPGAVWFPGATLNYVQQVFRHADAAHAAGHPALVFQNERMTAPVTVSWPALQRQTASLAEALRGMGVKPGDRVCAYLPNTPHAIVAFLACASIGAVWSVCSPDMGPVAVLDRFKQIAPKVLIAVDGQHWGGTRHDRRSVLTEVLAQLPSVEHLVFVADLDAAADAPPAPTVHTWADVTAAPLRSDWAPLPMPFDHPLWIVYSSGTTGLPKPIVHGHGGVVLQGLKEWIHNDLSPSIEGGERFFWFSSTGWIMWNAQGSALLNGTTVCIYDGNPSGPSKAPDWGTLWRFAGAAGVTWFGAGAAFYASCLKAGVEPMKEADLSRLHAIGSTGSPLSDECYQWIWDHLPKVNGQDIWLNPISGGTDFAGAFICGNRTLPVIKGEMQCRALGAAVFAFGEDGRELTDEVGELVCTQPMPSMPLYFWGDEPLPHGADGAGPPRAHDDGSGRPGAVVGQRYHDSYFDMFPNTWRHGDWIRITPRGGAVIYGRSDATINRHGIRMGTSELYRAVEAMPEVLDSLVVDLEYLGRESWMPLFVVLREGLVLDEALTLRLRTAIKVALSARHVPNDIFQVQAIPRTLSGKKMELPVKKLLMGADPARVLNRDAMANADAIDAFLALAKQRAAAAG